MTNLRAQTSSEMLPGGEEFKMFGIEEGEASRTVKSSAISAIVSETIELSSKFAMN